MVPTKKHIQKFVFHVPVQEEYDAGQLLSIIAAQHCFDCAVSTSDGRLGASAQDNNYFMGKQSSLTLWHCNGATGTTCPMSVNLHYIDSDKLVFCQCHARHWQWFGGVGATLARAMSRGGAPHNDTSSFRPNWILHSENVAGQSRF